LRTAYEREPGDFWINIYLATYASDWSDGRGRYLGSLDEGIAHFRAALAARPTSAAVHSCLGNALHQRGDLDGAIAEQREAIRLNPDYAGAYSNLGGSLVQRGDLEEAIEACREAIRLDPEDAAAAQMNLAVALGAQGDYEGALAANREAVRLDPNDPEARSNLGATLHVLGDLEGAVAAYREALRLDPNDRVAAFNLVFAQTTITRNKRIAKARPRLAAVLAGEEKPESADDCLGFAALCYAEKRYEAAAGFYREAFRQDPKLTADLATMVRYRAACTAAHAGTPEWRKQAVAWLRADLELWDSAGAPNVELTLLALAHWKRDPDLASIRDGDDLPEECRNLWADVEALRTRLMTGASK